MTDPPPIRYVPAIELRRLFNALHLTEAVETGTFTIQVKKDRHPSPPKAQEPVCTRSQAVSYLDAEGNQVAVAHRYLRQDGSIGASGRPDPKWILHEGVVWQAKPPAQS